MGTRLSTALIPVCIGSFTEIRGIIPGAFTPTRHLLITVTFVLSPCILIRYSGHLFNVVSSHHLYVIFSIKPLYNGKFILKIIPKVISEDQYFSQMYQKSRGVTKYID
jgi:hypothetical protein